MQDFTKVAASLGNNDHGELGLNDTTQRTSWTQINLHLAALCSWHRLQGHTPGGGALEVSGYSAHSLQATAALNGAPEWMMRARAATARPRSPQAKCGSRKGGTTV